MAITKNDIHATADNIVAEGGSPTLAAIRKALGGGSFTTISEAMKEWKAQHQAQTASAPIREAAPASVSDRLNVFGSEIWAIALEMANARLQSEREALELVRQELEETQAEAIDLADQLTIEIEQAQTTIQQQQDALARQEEANLENNAHLESEKVARHEAERKCEVIEAAMVEIRHQATELKLDTKALRSEVSDTSKKLASAEINLSNAVDRLDQIQSELEKALGIVSKRDALIAELKIQAAKDQAEITNAVNYLDQSQSKLEKALGIVSKRDALIAELKIQAAKDQAEVTNAVNRQDQSRSELEKALGIVSERDALIAELKTQAITDQSKKSKS